MTKEEIKEKRNEYSERHKFWTGQAMSQLGYSINMFTVISIGLLTYLIADFDLPSLLYLDFNYELNWKKILKIISVLLSFISVIFGLTSIISRLYDIRISRHILLTRKRVLNKHGKTLAENTIDLSSYSEFNNFIKTLILKIQFITVQNINNNAFDQKFDSLRIQSKLLGRVSWKSHKLQILCLFLTMVLYAFAC